MKRLAYPLLVTVCVGLAACSTSETQAPIDDLSIGAKAVQPVGPGYYTVTKGDTLYRISRTYGHSVADLVAWNSLGDANAINEGQVLRVVPPGTDAAATTVQTASVTDDQRDVQPISDTAATSNTVVEGTKEVNGVVWAWPANGKVINGFTEGQTKGIDIAGTQGQKVYAAAEGRVIYSGTMNGYGNLVIIKHSDELLTAYAHNSRNLVSQGSSVSRGDEIAEMGSSGTDTVKLHFEVRRQGKPVDPLGYLPQK